MSKSDLVDLTVVLKRETDKAWLVEFDEDKDPVWVPKSQAELHRNKKGAAWTLTCPEWLATDKGMV